MIRHNKCYSGFVKWMKSPNKDYIHDVNVITFGSWDYIWVVNVIFVRWFLSFNKTRVALIMSDYIPGCDIVTNFSTSDVWKFCQNWTSRQGASNLPKFPNIRSTVTQNCTNNIAWLFVYYWHDKITHLKVKLLKHFIQLLLRTILKVNIVSLFKLKFGAFVC